LKFDVSVWFKNASHDQCLTLIEILGDALHSFGSKPKEEYLMVLGVRNNSLSIKIMYICIKIDSLQLYRKHLQYAIIFHFPDYLSPVFGILL
jgi:hypothetical protein